MVNEVRAAVTLEPKKMVFQKLPYPEEIKEGDFIAKMRMSGICGTDHHMWAGQFPNTPWPVIQGHEVIAEELYQYIKHGY